MARLLLIAWLATAPTAAAAMVCDTRLDTGDFPGRLVIEIGRSEIAIGGVAPFAGGSGRIVATAGALRDGVAELEVEPQAFRIAPFEFPLWITAWTTNLTAENRGLGYIEIPPAGGPGAIRFEIRLRASNALGHVFMNARFTTGRSPDVYIAGESYRLEGTPLDLATGGARLVASGRTGSESRIGFRRVDYYARVDACLRPARAHDGGDESTR